MSKDYFFQTLFVLFGNGETLRALLLERMDLVGSSARRNVASHLFFFGLQGGYSITTSEPCTAKARNPGAFTVRAEDVVPSFLKS